MGRWRKVIFKVKESVGIEGPSIRSRPWNGITNPNKRKKIYPLGMPGRSTGESDKEYEKTKQDYYDSIKRQDFPSGTCLECGTKWPEEMVICEKCGTELYKRERRRVNRVIHEGY